MSKRWPVQVRGMDIAELQQRAVETAVRMENVPESAEQIEVDTVDVVALSVHHGMLAGALLKASENVKELKSKVKPAGPKVRKLQARVAELERLVGEVE